MAFLPTNASQIQQFAVALYGIQVGTTTMDAVQKDISLVGGLSNALNAYYAVSFGSTPTADVAASVAANLGLTGTAATDAAAYITAVLNGTAANARGVAIQGVLNLFSTLTSNATFGAAATAWNAKVGTAIAYTGTGDVAIVGGASAAGAVFTLTASIDGGAAFTGGSGNDTFTATDVFLGLNGTTPVYANTFGAGDSIDGGAGTNDTFNVTSAAAIAVPVATVKNIETANLISASTVSGDVSGWTGLTALNVTSVGGTTATAVKAAATTAVTYADSALGSAAVNIDGGSSVTSTTTDTIANTNGAITVGAAAAPKGAVVVNHTVKGDDGKAGGQIKVTGGTTVAVNQTAGNAVNSANTFGAVTITGTADTTAVTSTQTSAASKDTKVVGVINSAVDIIDANTSSGTATSSTKAGTITTATLTGFATAKVASAALTTLNLGGTGTSVATWEGGSNAATNTTLTVNTNALTLTGTLTDSTNQYKTINFNTTGTSSLKTSAVAIVDSALTTVNIAGSGSLAANLTVASVTAIDASASTGKNTITVDAAAATYAGGSGADIVTIAAVPTKTVSGGAGTADELVLNVAATTFANPSANAKLSGFEILGLGASATGTYDATGFTGLHIGGTITGDSVFSNVAAGTTLTIDAAPGKVVSYALKDATGTSDSVSITVNKATADGLDLSANSVDVTGIESVSISSLGTEITSATANKIKLADTTATTSVLKTITLTGNQDITVSDALTGTAKIATVDASAVTGAVNLSGVHVSASGAVITGSATNTNVLTGAAGADTITGGAKADTITSGAGLDTLTGGAGADTFVLGLNANGNQYATITDFTKTAGTVTGDTIDLSGLTVKALASAVTALGSAVTLASTAAFADYLNAAASGHAAAGTTAAVVSWFQFSGNTYIVVDNNDADAFTSNASTGDQVVKLTGLVDLSKAAISISLNTELLTA